MRKARTATLVSLLFAALLLALSTADALATTFANFTTIDDPLGPNGSYATGISGSNIVGYHMVGTSSLQGFLYDGSTFTELGSPNGPNAQGGYVRSIDGNNIVGNYYANGTVHGWLYDGSTYKTIDDPLGKNNVAWDIDGSKIVGQFETVTTTGKGRNTTTVTHVHGYLSPDKGLSYNLQLDDPQGVNYTIARAISGNKIVGGYNDAAGVSHGFLYDITAKSYTNLDDPLEQVFIL